jgi:23S rRNA (cytidine1920-2'-O)/16S rRNA (cytidine1409-2'-O)-methyltransferase
VWNAEQRVDKPGSLLPATTALRLVSGPRFVSRGGEKLEHALEAFAAAGLNVSGKICVDIGAATGGFTDCLLQRGAALVHAVDVGYGQLHPRLRADPRVVVRERVNARSLTAADFAERIELVVVDASFISLGKLLAAIAAMVPAGGELVALVKPQFEAGRIEVSRGRGVIRDERVREQAIATGREAVRAGGFEVVAETDSPIRGPKGNLERLLYARRNGA